MTLHVLITVDTESYAAGDPDRHIWGHLDDGKEYGIRMIMDMLEKRGARGTFYLNVYEAERHGDEAIRAVISEIHGRGHDVQLHTHPRDRYGIEKLTRADVSRQREILAWGKDFIEAQTGLDVIAHRAGAFAANLDTIEALSLVGIPVDASLSPAWFESHLAQEVVSNNRPFDLRGVLELPVTYYVQGRFGKREYLRLVDIEASSLRELKHIVRQALDAKVSTINFLMHSHSFVRNGRSDLALIKRFEAVLAYLSAQPGVKLSTTTQFHELWKSGSLQEHSTERFTPRTGWWLTYLRTLESVGKGWKNTVAALLPPVVLAASIGFLFIVLT
ncbi:MAG: hypothetical protein B7Y41_04695 [Hydrogenophilales bacterium 28-61-23]|nr:MAG: hypothetical protein B7Y41_04695 [Hydrogenophilales bacterium 28-61-23]